MHSHTSNSGIFLGISLCSLNYFCKARVRAYANWALEQDRPFLVLLADTTEVVNCRYFLALSERDAKDRTSRITDQAEVAMQRAISSHPNATVLRASQWTSTSLYDQVYRAVSDEFSANSGFASAVHDTVLKNIYGKLACKSDVMRAVSDLSDYVLHEIALSIFLKWYHTPPFPTQVSPKPDNIITATISGGRYGVLTRLGHQPESYEYIYLELESE